MNLVSKGQTLIVWQSAQDPFGEVEEVVNVVEQNLRFAGQYFDVETGLHYNYHRSYDPLVGRYIESDPLGVIAGLSTFGYVRGNPLTRTDKYGLSDWGLGGGSCCNNSSRTQWVIVGGASEDGTGVWMPLQSGQCTGLTSDCDGMSCGGGFYRASNIQDKFLGAISCEDDENNPNDGESCQFAGEDRRWTPSQSGSDAQSPASKGASTGNNPPSPNYPWLAGP